MQTKNGGVAKRPRNAYHPRRGYLHAAHRTVAAQAAFHSAKRNFMPAERAFHLGMLQNAASPKFYHTCQRRMKAMKYRTARKQQQTVRTASAAFFLVTRAIARGTGIRAMRYRGPLRSQVAP